MRPILPALLQHRSALLAAALLASLAWWGHRTGWRLERPAAASPPAGSEDWCSEHHVPEAVCLSCRRELGREMAAREPAHHRQAGETPRFAQIASPGVLAAVGIRVEPVRVSAVAPRLLAPGETAYPPDGVVRLGSRCDAVVRQMLAGVGDQVAADAVVAVVETAEAGRAKSALMQAVAALDLARTQALRARVTAAAGIRTTAELEEVEARLRSAEVAVFDAEQGLRNLGLAVEAGTLSGLDAGHLAMRLRRLGLPDGMEDGGSANLLPLRAPRAGTVTEVRAVVGEAVEANAPLLVIADLASLWAALPMTPERAALVSPGRAVSFASASGIAADGAVAVIAQAADPHTRLVTVWARLDNPGRRLRVGIFGSAAIAIGEPSAAARVPAGAVQFDGDRPYVFVRRSDTVFRALPVRVLAREDGLMAVDRLAEGDEIAVAGTATLFAAAFLERLGAGCCAVE